MSPPIEPGRLHRDPGQHAHDEVNAEDSRPETCRTEVRSHRFGAAPATRARRSAAPDHRALREEIAECNGKCEMKAMNQERSIHEDPRLALRLNVSSKVHR